MINTRMQLLHKYRTKSLNAQKNIFEGSVLLNIVMICVILNARLHVLQWVKMGQSTIIVGHTYCLSLTLECGPNCPTPYLPRNGAHATYEGSTITQKKEKKQQQQQLCSCFNRASRQTDPDNLSYPSCQKKFVY